MTQDTVSDFSRSLEARLIAETIADAFTALSAPVWTSDADTENAIHICRKRLAAIEQGDYALLFEDFSEAAALAADRHDQIAGPVGAGLE